MPQVLLTLEIVQDLDIKSGRLVGIIVDKRYTTITDSHELDMAQCFLWLDLVRILSFVMEAFDYEDIEIPCGELGRQIRTILASKSRLFPFLLEFIEAVTIENDETLGVIVDEMMADIRQAYHLLQEDWDKIIQTQDQIDKWIAEMN